MTLMIPAAEPLPLHQDPDGSVRVGGTRVLLDVVVLAYRNGASAEQIVDQYPLLDVADVYAVIAFYLRHAAAVDAYLEGRRREAAELRAEIEAKFNPRGLRERLLARRAARG
jgi:uncharacterized protein (DUF433 family)